MKIMKPRNIVILTGSGISAESGIATFRDPDGVWAKYDYQEVATPEGFAKNPALVHEFYNKRRAGLTEASPNAAHIALAKLEEHLASCDGTCTLVTQNVDDLHERGGSKHLLHMHGELTKIRCEYCGSVEQTTKDISTKTKCENCDAVGGMRPDIVWFGEMPKFLDEIELALQEADLFVSIGTSGAVYPAAGMVSQARALGIDAIELNLEKSENAHLFTEGRYGPAGVVVPKWVNELIGAKG